MFLSYNSEYFILESVDGRVSVKSDTHFHESVEVYYLQNGIAYLYANNHTYQLNAGDLIIIPPYTYHKMWYGSETHSRLLINCTTTFVPKSVYAKLNNIIYIGKNSELARYLDKLFHKIQEAVDTSDEYQEDTLHCLMMDLFLSAVKSSDNFLTPYVSNPYVSQAIAYIQNNFRSKITLVETAAHCTVSPEYLSRIFRKETGMTFKEYLKFCRLKTAHSILSRGTTMSVAEVAFSCGFNDSNYFSTLYKQTYHIPPSQVTLDKK